MTRPPDDLTAALHRLRAAVRARTALPAPARLRARAIRAQRVRRTSAALLAVAAVVALAAGGAQVARLTAHQPVPPAGTPAPTGTPPTGTPSPTASPLPPPVPAVTPSPRPAPLPPQPPPDDPIARVDWYHATITLPDSDHCPTGTVGFAPFGNNAGEPAAARVFADGKVLDISPGDPGSVSTWAYGDITGDGRLEAVMEARCFLSDDGTDHGSGHGLQLLAVARAGDGTLTGLGWLGPRGAAIMSVWISGGRVLMVGDPWTVDPADHFPLLPGLVLSYRWDGARFAGWEPAAEYPPIVPLDPDRSPPPVRPRAVAAGLGCPDDELRFVAEPSGGLWTASASDAVYAVPVGPSQQYLFDLDNTGQRLLVMAVACTGPDGWTREGLAVFERAGDGWRGISVLTPPAGHGIVEAGRWEADRDGFRVDWARPTGPGAWDLHPVRYRWTGTTFEPAGE